jgi:hypothetical protein
MIVLGLGTVGHFGSLNNVARRDVLMSFNWSYICFNVNVCSQQSKVGYEKMYVPKASPPEVQVLRSSEL